MNYKTKIEFFTERSVRISKFKRDYNDKLEIGKQNLEILLKNNQNKLTEVKKITEEDFDLYSSKYVQVKMKNNGEILFYHNNNLLITDSSSKITEHHVQSSKKPFMINQTFKISIQEGLYGLGQHQKVKLNRRNLSLKLDQHNTIVSIPLLLSTNGYGILWENLGESFYDQKEDSIEFRSSRADAIHYWIIFGPNFDKIIRDYRLLTGNAPMYAKWGYGFIQSRNRYWTREEVMNVVKKHREMKLPIDVIVIDYIYYGKHGVGSHKFDEDNFPDPKSMIEEFHNKYNVKLLLSIWPTFDKHADTYEVMEKEGYLLDCFAMGGQFYDPFNPDAGKKFWNILDSRLYSLGVDAWWLDASEPDDEKRFREISTYLGDAMDYLNIYSLFHTKNVFSGQIRSNPKDRPFLLTRSAFIGQQRYAAATWSGDVLAKFKELQNQIPSGLNFCAAGIPYWCTDIGGYKGGWAKNPIYRECFIRWYQFGTFCPIFRSHGRRYPRDRKGKNEIWEYGKRATNILREFSNIRYKLLPYIYSIAWKVYNEGYTLMRLLAFDFPKDENVYEINDQFLFGPSLLINPITKFGQRSRQVYLPDGKWYDYWTNKEYSGNKFYKIKTPLSKIPIFVRAGSIIPMAPEIQYCSEFDWLNYDIDIYPGENGTFILYFDDGTSNDYKKDRNCILELNWNDTEEKLSINQISNHYFENKEEILFRINIVGKEVYNKTFKLNK